ncbi:unnamed protein product [Didymodactylos carnosus]|uniref:Uncharacterized protein n=1 Tax=Didymodactylos carnosus TaxID=1234261 RepID=A0A8S2EA58_9BILA|nr:unnamed protein product [Didymodactylos carnosus]CAF3979627.1 unnamed protein product [Didymodactylos carnosus]CAF4478639.1 unnamed protein product [Didymodactylos carnosus]
MATPDQARLLSKTFDEDTTSPSLKRLRSELSPKDVRATFIEALKSDPMLQRAVADIVQTNSGSIIQSADKIVDVMYDGIVKQIGERLDALEARIAKIEAKTEDLQRYNRSFNLRFYGFEEREDGNVKDRLVDFFNTHMNLKLNANVIENCHRLPTAHQHQKKPRAIIARLYSRPIRQLILSSLGQLKGKNLNITVVEDLTPLALALFHRTRGQFKDKEKKRVIIRNGRVFVRNSDKSLTLVTE